MPYPNEDYGIDRIDKMLLQLLQKNALTRTEKLAESRYPGFEEFTLVFVP